MPRRKMLPSPAAADALRIARPTHEVIQSSTSSKSGTATPLPSVATSISRSIPQQGVVITEPSVVAFAHGARAIAPQTMPAGPKKVTTRLLKYHQTAAFLSTESAVGVITRPEGSSSDVGLLKSTPWFLGRTAGECYRVAATLRQSSAHAVLHVKAVSWGYGSSDGALGLNNTRSSVRQFRHVPALRHDHVRQVSAGNRSSLFLTASGHVWQCGRLWVKQDGVKMLRPQRVSFQETSHHACGEDPENKQGNAVKIGDELVGREFRIVQVEAAHLAAYALDERGQVYSWGTLRYGQLGHGERISNEVTKSLTDSTERVETSVAHQPQENDYPKNVPEPSTSDATDDEDGEENRNSVDSDEDTKQAHRPEEVALKTPHRITSLSLSGVCITMLSAGNHFVLALSSHGYAYSWGRNAHGQLGLGGKREDNESTDSNRDQGSPQLIRTLSPFVVLGLAAGHSHAAAVAVARGALPSSSEYSIVFAWGSSADGRLGIGDPPAQTASESTRQQGDYLEPPREVFCSTPSEVTFFRGLHATRVTLGHDHSLVLCAVGCQSFLYAFGGNRFGQLGVARTLSSSVMPLLVDELSGSITLTELGAGGFTSAAITGDGELYMWGDCRHGKTARVDARVTYAPWRVYPPDPETIASSVATPTDSVNSKSVLPDDCFLTQLSVGAHHSLALFRTHGKMDRWRRFPVGEIAAALPSPGEGNGFARPVICVCASSRTRTASEEGILLYCESCGIGPLCRVCSRRCHVDHALIPWVADSNTGSPGQDEFRQDDGSDDDEQLLGAREWLDGAVHVRCGCGERRPQSASQGVGVLASVPIDAAGAHPELCKLASLPETIPEEVS